MKKILFVSAVAVMFAMFAITASAHMCDYHQWKPCKAKATSMDAGSVRSTDMCGYHQWKMKKCKAEAVIVQETVTQGPKTVKEEVIILEGVYFDSGKSTIKTESHPILDKNAKKLHKKKDLFIEVIGYTDNVGNDKYNQKLSEARAIAVKEYFVQNGILEERIVAIGMGEANPIADNSTPEGRAKNRRIEIKHKK